jgi:hypothetical protein
VLSAVVGIVLWGASAAQAAPQNGLTPTETLQDLINLNATGGVRIGNLIFSDFSYSGNASPNPAPSASQINVANSPYSGTGLEFVASWSGFTGGNQDSLISYAIQAAPGFVLTGVQLDFNGAAHVMSTGTEASVNETVSTLVVDGSGNPVGAGTVLQQITVYNTQSQVSNPNNPPLTVLETSMNVVPNRTGLFITKDIQANGGTNGTASISYVANTYQITTSPIPEPLSTGLLGTMGCGLLVRRRRS